MAAVGDGVGPVVGDGVGIVDESFSECSLENVRQLMSNFAKERDWEQYHTPRNLVLAMVGEVGELAEIFQWKGEVKPGVPNFSENEKTHLEEELSDVLLYLVRIADRCNVDLAKAVKEKVEKNAKKYPAEECKGSSAKYTEYVKKSKGEETSPKGEGTAPKSEEMVDVD